MGDPNFLTAVVDDGVLVWVMVGGGSTRQGGEELREMFDLVSKGAWGWDGVNRSFNDGWGKVLNRDVSEGNTDNGVFKLSVGVFVLVLGGPLKDWAIEGL